MTDAEPLLPWLVVLPVVALAIGWLVGRRRVHELELELAQARAAIQTD
jgi:sorbitol-specific phosphotransferase system component IIC